MSATISSPAQYLVSYGVSGIVGSFVPADDSSQYERGMQVLVRSERGREAGTVLCQGSAVGLPDTIAITPGVILGPLPEQYSSEQERLDAQAAERFREVRQLIKALFVPMQLVDIEVLAEPETVVIHVLLFGPTDYLPLQKQLSDRWKTTVLFHDITNPEALSEAAESGCGSCESGGGCGSGGCGSGGGCSTGGCHSSSSSHGEFDRDWQAYFAELRQGMERRGT